MSWASEQVERYRDLEPLYHAFAHRLHDLLEQLVEDADLRLWNSYSWTRSVARFEAALYRSLREGRRLGDSLDEVGDFAGVALVTGTRGDVDTIAEIVERELEIDYARSLTPAAARAANERNLASESPALRYEHATYIAALGEDRRHLAEWSAYGELRLEVHVPTISEYAWWSTENSELPFHWASSYPPSSREAFARVAALYAEIDDVLASHEAAEESVDERYVDAFAAGDLDVPLDAAALAVYMARSDPLDELKATAEAAGMKGVGEYREPASRDLEQEGLWLLGRYGIGTVAALDEFLRDATPRAPDIFRQLAQLSTERGFVPYAMPGSLLTFLLLVLNRADADTVELVEYREEVQAALNMLIGNPLPPATEQLADG